MRIFIDLQVAQTELQQPGQQSTALKLAKSLAQQASRHEIHFVLNEQLGCDVEALKEALGPAMAQDDFRIFCTPTQDPSDGRTISRLVYTDFIEHNRPDILVRLDIPGAPGSQVIEPSDTQTLSCPTVPLRSNDDLQTILKRLHDPAAHAAASSIEPTIDIMQCLAKEARQYSGKSDLIRSIAKAMAFNRRPDKRQLLLDVSVLAITDAKSGIQRVVRSIFMELLNCPPEGYSVRAIRFTNGQYHYANEFTAKSGNIPCMGADEPIDFYQGDIYLSLDLNMNLTSQVEPIYKDLRNKGVELFFIVYDMLPIQHPEWWHDEISPMYRAWFEMISRNASGLCCISGAVAQEVSTWLSQNPPERAQSGPKVSSFHLGADLENSMPSLGLPDTSDEVLDAIQNSHSFLMVSTIEPRKGHRQTLDAFELMWDQGLDVKLVIVGRRGWLVDSLLQRINEHPENGKRLLWLDGISDEYLEKIYAASTCLIAASEGEGFGLPLIEAAQHRLPILARSLPVFKEVAGEHAHYFEGLSPQALAHAIQEWLALYLNNRHPQSTHLPWLNWKQSAQQLLGAIQHCTGQILSQEPPQAEMVHEGQTP